ncbi:hypothetical protein COT64_01000 [Candidatus Shapirobacteria bacterium CG09_land_8_20_14_0_10_39_12]|uniref:DUF4870 domain-containing protein n=1 Tax=Candidatus Shapirobacteria bacterium CG09_land_8_20_14_0_10_39_12 TaxID=1974885 RepID=A0A2H0WQ06_9BACT|nr:MAG: hypothetical protein COT64_01000 [Candidatus Shapirobacteria bacterium CG09_land_8_20_14_0_10_39_12]
MTEGKSTFGLEKNVACALTYVFGWVSGLVFFLSEKQDKDIRFNAAQSIIVFGALTVLGMVPAIGVLLSPIIFLGGLVLWVVLVVKAYQGAPLRLPVVGNLADKLTNK